MEKGAEKEVSKLAEQEAAEAGAKAASKMAAQIAEEEGAELIGEATAEAAAGPAGWAMLAFQAVTMVLSIMDPTGILMELTPSSIESMGKGQLGSLPKALAKNKMWPMYVAVSDTIPPPYRSLFNKQMGERSMWYSYHSERYKAHYAQWHECSTKAVAKYKANELTINFKNEYDCYLKQDPSLGLNKLLSQHAATGAATGAATASPAPVVIPPDPSNEVLNRNVKAHHKLQKDQVGSIVKNLDKAPMFSGDWGEPVTPTAPPTAAPTAGPAPESDSTDTSSGAQGQDSADDEATTATETSTGTSSSGPLLNHTWTIVLAVVGSLLGVGLLVGVGININKKRAGAAAGASSGAGAKTAGTVQEG